MTGHNSSFDKQMMQRCLELARRGGAQALPNPLVGSVIVHEGRIIGEGWHERFGGPHGEVHAVNSVSEADRKLFPEATIYINLEPCAHQGKTPPCADMLVREGFKRVVIGLRDPNPKVNGGGIQKLLDAGIEVSVGLLQAEGRKLNRFFLSAFEKQRPWIMLKWAESSDGFAGTAEGGPTPLTGKLANRVSHQWRGFYQSILVGTNTAAADNPSLGTRLAPGPDPLRIAVDLDSKLTHSLQIFDGSIPTLIVCRDKRELPQQVEVLEVKGLNWIPELLNHLHSRGIQSLMVEGGPILQRSFLEQNLWDEIRRWKTPVELGPRGGSPVAEAPTAASHQEFIGPDQLLTYYRQSF